MQKPDSHTIQEATQRAKQRLPIGELQRRNKYKDITEQEYNDLFDCAETFSLLILESLSKEKVVEQEI
ncbi:hypothetical protein [Carboxylicivirga caseinilyticus]|uniref:hypothetical protein n=1 Tax=Carboxylicivirga caseinilyticus TaxID=3417572 RepID=UPI003D3591E3|nr:hypothetical protein [Marinilabiliaceae bacterium A049]